MLEIAVAERPGGGGTGHLPPFSQYIITNGMPWTLDMFKEWLIVYSNYLFAPSPFCGHASPRCLGGEQGEVSFGSPRPFPFRALSGRGTKYSSEVCRMGEVCLRGQGRMVYHGIVFAGIVAIS